MKTKRFLPFIVLAILLSGCSLFNQSTPDPRENTSYFGVNSTKAIHISDSLDSTIKQRVEMMEELGVSWDRINWLWNVVEPRKNKFDFRTMDKLLKFYKKNKINIYPVLCYGAAWWKDRNSPINEKEIEDYLCYVKVVVNRYKGQIKYWSIWNEPNNPDFWQPAPNPELYAKLLKKTYKAIKKIDPTAVVCAPSLAPTESWDKAYFEKMCQLGCLNYFDVFDYHYKHGNMPEIDFINEIKAVMLKYKNLKPIWISETAITGKVKKKEKSYDRQASLMVRGHLAYLANGVEKIFYFGQDNQDDKKESFWNSKPEIIQDNGKEKTAFYAYKTMISQIDHNEIIGKHNTHKGSISQVLYYNKGSKKYSLAMWTNNDKNIKSFPVYCNSQLTIAIGTFGKKNELISKSGPLKKFIIKVGLSKFPVYVHNVAPEMYLPETGIKLVNPIVELFPGENVSLKIKINHLLNIKNHKIKVIKLSKGLEYNSEEQMLYASKTIKSGKKSILLLIKANATINGITQKIAVKRKAVVNILPSI